MKVSVWIVLAAGITVLGLPAHAAQEPSRAAAPAAPAAAVSAKDEMKLVQSEAEAKLKASVWGITLTPIGDSKTPGKQDKLSFESGKVLCESLSKEGFSPSNYTLTVGDDKVAVWETMQTSSSNALAFWRGELHGDTMRGILSRHTGEGAAQDFAFSGKITQDAPAMPKVEPKTDTVSTQAPPAAPTPSAVETAAPAAATTGSAPASAAPGVAPATAAPAISAPSAPAAAAPAQPVIPAAQAPVSATPAASTPAPAAAEAPATKSTQPQPKKRWGIF